MKFDQTSGIRSNARSNESALPYPDFDDWYESHWPRGQCLDGS